MCDLCGALVQSQNTEVLVFPVTNCAVFVQKK